MRSRRGRPPKFHEGTGLVRCTLELAPKHILVIESWANKLGCSRSEALRAVFDAEAWDIEFVADEQETTT